MSRRHFNKLDMRYASPDYIRPNPHLLERTRRNFVWKKFKNPPSPHLLPMPPIEWQKKMIPLAISDKLDKKVKLVTGKNRTWKITPLVARGIRNRKRMKTNKKYRKNKYRKNKKNK